MVAVSWCLLSGVVRWWARSCLGKAFPGTRKIPPHEFGFFFPIIARVMNPSHMPKHALRGPGTCFETKLSPSQLTPKPTRRTPPTPAQTSRTPSQPQVVPVLLHFSRCLGASLPALLAELRAQGRRGSTRADGLVVRCFFCGGQGGLNSLFVGFNK